MINADLSTPSDVITLCDHETCPTIKNNNKVNTVFVVKSKEHLHSIEAGRNYDDDIHSEPTENRTVGGAHQ